MEKQHPKKPGVCSQLAVLTEYAHPLQDSSFRVNNPFGLSGLAAAERTTLG